MDEQGCPRCKTTKYRNPSLKLMVNVCGHTLCESCVELLFVRGAGNCHECDTPLRKSNFRVQLFDDPAVDKEVEIRKKVLKIYNKREDDFPSLSEYNDFLEEIEEIVFNLTNNVDLENTKRKMELYQKDNKEVIQKNKIKLTREQKELEEALEVERQENEQRRLLEQKEEQLQQMMKRKNKQALLDELESSSLPASLLLAQHKDKSTQLETQLEKPKPVKPVTFSTGIKMGQHISLSPVQKLEETLYEYQPLEVETYGPPVPELESLGRLGWFCCLKSNNMGISRLTPYRSQLQLVEFERPQWLSVEVHPQVSEVVFWMLVTVRCGPASEKPVELHWGEERLYVCFTIKRGNSLCETSNESALVAMLNTPEILLQAQQQLPGNLSVIFLFFTSLKCVTDQKECSLCAKHTVPRTQLRYLNHVRAASPQDVAGGYTSSLACHRALQDAFSGLFWFPS
ncbi:hypothetical protein ASZ78_015507 [Callipepla squamata]|uniref:CDK-activating kinase assembly factor MAT1 n=1 Tax=Callipepla squamata TaxID=9009 RepID=A0A226MIF0_CALSU|nr:hypothetical protein ASZ78_015507 [Callipepla squamata]